MRHRQTWRRVLGRHGALMVILAPSLLGAQEVFQPPHLRLGPAESNGWRHVVGERGTNAQFITLMASSNLVDWETIAWLHNPEFDFIDPVAPQLSQRYYRLSSVPVPWQDTNGVWQFPPPIKNQVDYPQDPFLGGNPWEELTDPWIKFLIDLDRPARVFYGSSATPFHHEFAATWLEPFIGIGADEFERLSMHNEGRRLLRGTVLYPFNVTGEYGIQFVSTDPLPAELVIRFFELVRSTVAAPRGVRPFYIPTYDQYPAAQAQQNFFASNGIPIDTAERWAAGDLAQSTGWALGRLRYVATTNIARAYASGELLPTDILITDGVPAELPYVAGVITLAPATANSHAAILARSYGVPFVYFIDAAERARALQLTNREVLLQTVTPLPYRPARALLVELDPEITPETRAEILALKTAPPLNYTPTARYGSYWADTTDLVPADIRYFGGKAANYGLLRRTLPTNSLPAIAISFDLWNEFLEQPLAGGNTLRQEISNRLAGFTFPANVAAVQTNLAAIRSLVRNATVFTANQEAAITNALARFDRRRNIRFRSSTNVEDAELFSGAGLYDSFSGCLADDQDGDTIGPSACDPTETAERGVFRAIRRVFASFYNDNAYLERLRLGVNEHTVGMALLVHHSTPDEFELANGVATLTRRVANPNYDGLLVTQLGAVSVANPAGTALPEETSFSRWESWQGPRFTQLRYSSLVPYGVRLMDWPTEYDSLAGHLMNVADAYHALFPNKPEVVLDLEYKKVSPGHLEIKQVREVPQIAGSNVPPYLLNAPVTVVNFQGVYGGLWATHRLKSRWTFRTRNMSLTQSNLAGGIFTDVTVEHLNGVHVQTATGPLSSFPNATRRRGPNYWSDRFTLPTGDGPADFELAVYDLDPASSQVPFIRGVAPFVSVQYQNPRPSLHADFGDERVTIRLLTNASTWFRAPTAESSRDTFRDFTFNVPGQGTNVSIRTSFWLGSELVHGDRPPLLRFVETVITGLTAEPIRLRGYWSQTFDAFHWAGNMLFLFEPRLEEGLPAAQHQELAAANIAMIYLNANGHQSYRFEQGGVPPGCYVMSLIGLDGSIRRFSDCDFGD